MNHVPKLEDHSIYAWVGEDEAGSGKIALKEGLSAQGYTPLVAMDYDRSKIETLKLRASLEHQARSCGKKIRLVRYVFSKVIAETEGGI